MYKKGFSLIEIIIVIGILGLLTAISVATFVTFRNSQGLNKDTETVVEVLEQARTQTLSSQNGSAYGVHFGTSAVTLFAGGTYAAGAAGNQIFSLLSSDTILTITLTGAGSDVVFNRLTGETGQDGTIVLSSASAGRTRTVTIYKTGVVEYK